MPWLLIPLLLVAIFALWALLLPFALLQRYRHGKARRRAQPLAVRINAWMLLGSMPLFVLGAWVSSRWIAGAATFALAGMGAGLAIGVVGLWLSRFEARPQGLYYTPPAWLVLALTGLVAARIALGIWQAFQRWHGGGGLPAMLADHASLFAVGGLLLGYYLAYAWGLKRRLV